MVIAPPALEARWPGLARAAWMLLLATLVFAAGNALYRNKTNGLWKHPDQVIPIRVLQSMHQRGDRDTDWARTSMPGHFHKFHYNFSGYLIASKAVLDTAGGAAYADEALLADDLLRISRVFSAFTLVLVFLQVARYRGWLHGLAAAAAVSAVPQLLQDANYMRPEAIGTFLFTLVFCLALPRPRGTGLRLLQVAVLCLLAGFLTTIKFTYAIGVLFAAAPAISWLEARSAMSGTRKRQAMDLSTLAAVVVLSLLAGMWMGAPYALRDPSGYLEGLRALGEQYSGGHPPHSRMTEGPLSQGGAIAGYYLAVFGPLLLLLHLFGYCGRQMAPAKYVFAIIFGVTLCGFLSQRVFFERNFSLLLPVLVAIAAIGAANVASAIRVRLPTFRGKRLVLGAAASALLLLAALTPAMTSARLAPLFSREGFVAHRGAINTRIAAAQARSGAPAFDRLPFGAVHAMHYPDDEECRLYVTSLFADDWSRRFLERLPERFERIDMIPSIFSDITMNTLYTYHSADTLMFVDRERCGLPLQ